MPIDRRTGIVRWLFVGAGIYGLLAVAPLYPGGGEGAFYRQAFAGAAGATQLLYLMIGLDFRRYRPLIWVGVASKCSFAIPALLMIADGRLGRGTLPFAIIDLVLAAAFVAAWAWTRDPAAR